VLGLQSPGREAARLINKRRTSRQQRADVQPSRQCAKRPSAAFQAAGDEGVAHGSVSRLEQQLGLQRDGDVFGQLACAVLDVVLIGECRL